MSLIEDVAKGVLRIWLRPSCIDPEVVNELLAVEGMRQGVRERLTRLFGCLSSDGRDLPRKGRRPGTVELHDPATPSESLETKMPSCFLAAPKLGSDKCRESWCEFDVYMAWRGIDRMAKSDPASVEYLFRKWLSLAEPCDFCDDVQQIRP